MKPPANLEITGAGSDNIDIESIVEAEDGT